MTDRLNTIFGWVLFAGIVALGLSVISGLYFRADHPERPEQLGYVIEGAEEEGGAEGPDLATLLAAATPEAGEGVFAKCTACHTIAQGGPNQIGPNLWAVLGKPIGKHAAGFAYSSALAEKGGDWTYEAMDDWLAAPRAFASGTKMSFAGLSKPEDRAAVIRYMYENGGGPPLPTPAAAVEEAPAEGAQPDDADAGSPPADSAEAAGAVASEEPSDDTTSINAKGN